MQHIHGKLHLCKMFCRDVGISVQAFLHSLLWAELPDELTAPVTHGQQVSPMVHYISLAGGA